ncbi:hypothetical protein [Kineococcus sp. SYSU DK003]|uniref:hypothetical protein n=1 Tax=Kineococcus sp. SYSU DK003 TaxID=3383124 RepID=UPI003D7D291D
MSDMPKCAMRGQPVGRVGRRAGPSVEGVFAPWGNVVLIVVAVGLMAFWIRDAQRRQRRGEKSWTGAHKLGVVAMLLLVLSQALLLI